MLTRISSMLDAIADRLEAQGLVKQAFEIDKISDAIETHGRSPLTIKEDDALDAIKDLAELNKIVGENSDLHPTSARFETILSEHLNARTTARDIIDNFKVSIINFLKYQKSYSEEITDKQVKETVQQLIDIAFEKSTILYVNVNKLFNWIKVPAHMTVKKPISSF